MKSILIGILFLTAKVSAQGEELKCYDCMWDMEGGDNSNQDCIDNLSPALISSCPIPEPPDGTEYMRICTASKIYKKSTKELIHVDRGCNYMDVELYEEGCEKTLIGDIEGEMCICGEDECNDNRGPSTEESSTGLTDSSTTKNEGIFCYKCFWGEGDSDSDEDCVNSPADHFLIPCPDPPSDEFKYACGLAKGFEKGTNNMIILNRMGCLFFPNDEYEEGCFESEEVVDGVEIDAETCFCEEDKCNDGSGPSTEEPTTPKPKDLKCYECQWENGIENPDCIDNLSSDLLVTCPKPPNDESMNVCIVGKVFNNSTEELMMIARSCLIVNKDEYKEGCQTAFDIEICYCHEDGCNGDPSPDGAPLPKMTFIILIWSIFITAIL